MSDSPPDYPLNAYHIEAKPRVISLQKPADEDTVCAIQVDCLSTDKSTKVTPSKLELKKLQPASTTHVDHDFYRQAHKGLVTLALTNDLS